MTCTQKGHYIALTAKHGVKEAKEREFRLGHIKYNGLISNIVAGYYPHPEDVDAAILVLKDKEVPPSFRDLSIGPDSIAAADEDVETNDLLILVGFPEILCEIIEEQGSQRFNPLSYVCNFSESYLDSSGR